MEQGALEQRLAALEAELESLRAQVSERSEPTAAAPVPPVSRRMLLGGAMAGAAAAAAGVLVSASPAAADAGNMQYGQSNDAGGSQTTLLSTTPGRTFTVDNDSGLSSGGGIAGSAENGVGVDGITVAGTGTKGSAQSGSGLRGVATTGTGATLSATNGIGVDVTGGKAQLFLRSDDRTPPTGDGFAHQKGELVLDLNGDLWLCVAAGTPGTWRKVSGGTTAGALHLLPAPVRIYDSRAGNPPNVAPQTPLAAAEVRTLDTTANSSGVPVGATGLIVNCAVVDAVAGDANFTVWADLVARPKATTMVWGGSTGRCSTLAVTAISPARKIRVASSVRTDVVVDVVGYYR